MPAGIGGDKPAQGRAHNQGGETGPGDVSDGLRQFVFGRSAQHNEAADGHHHGSANALRDAHESELGERVRCTAEQGREGEDGNGGRKDGTGAKAVSHPSTDGDKHGQREQVGRHADVEVNGAYAKAARHLRQRGSNDGAVQILHEEGAGDERRDV